MSDIATMRAITRRHVDKSDALAALSLGANLIAYFAFLGLAIANVDRPLILLPAMVALAFAGVRLYVLQHDCGHLSLFSSRRANEWAGYLLSTFTFTPFRVMQYNHNLHHAHVGDLDARDTTEIHTMTLAEWRRASPGRRLFYRLYRNPFLMIPLGAFWTYFLAYRWPRNTRKVGVTGVLVHDALLLAYLAGLYALSGWAGVGVLLAATWLGGMLGVFLVYLQHNFDGTWWDRRPGLDFAKATLQGSSCLDFGWLFDEAVANITKHDIHHFNAAIPSYRLRAAHRDLERHIPLRRIGLGAALASFRLKLWDEEAGRLIPFPRD